MHVQAAHRKQIFNRDVQPSNLMYSQSTVYLVDWGCATLQQCAAFEGTVHYALTRVLSQLIQGLDMVKVGPSDDLDSLVASPFCISHSAALDELHKVAKLPAAVMEWWTQTWASRPQWRLALTAARAANHGTVAGCLQALLE